MASRFLTIPEWYAHASFLVWVVLLSKRSTYPSICAVMTIRNFKVRLELKLNLYLGFNDSFIFLCFGFSYSHVFLRACSATFSFNPAGYLEYCLGIAQKAELTPWFWIMGIKSPENPLGTGTGLFSSWRCVIFQNTTSWNEAFSKDVCKKCAGVVPECAERHSAFLQVGRTLVRDTGRTVLWHRSLLGTVTWGQIAAPNQRKKSLNRVTHMLVECLTHEAVNYQGIWPLPWVHRPYQLCSLLSPSPHSLHHWRARQLQSEAQARGYLQSEAMRTLRDRAQT